MNAEPNPNLEDLPPAQSHRLIEFERADVISPRIYPPRNVLVVTGRKPWANMVVTLNPRTYFKQPEYWGIEVVGTMPMIGQPAIVPYAVELKLEGMTGAAGIEVIGADRTEKIELAAPPDAPQYVGLVEGGRLRRMLPTDLSERELRLTTAGLKDDVAPESLEIDLRPDEGSMLRVRGDHEGGWIYSAEVVERQPDSILSAIARHVFADSLT
jgi:hypothetical protein